MNLKHLLQAAAGEVHVADGSCLAGWQLNLVDDLTGIGLDIAGAEPAPQLPVLHQPAHTGCLKTQKTAW